MTTSDPRTSYAPVNGLDMYYEIHGGGAPLLLLHGAYMTIDLMDAILSGLAASRQVIAVEQQGHGHTADIDRPITYEQMADDSAGLLDHLGVERADVVGYSMGGGIALQMAIRHPGIATKLILADCGAAFSEPGREAFRNMAAATKAKGLAAITDVAMRRLFAPEFQADHPDLMADRRAAFLRTDPEVFRAACDALAGLDLRPELGKVNVPVLVLVGEHDEATPPPMSHELAAGLPQARLEIIPGCAHVPQLQSPDVFLDAIGDFLSSPKLRAVAN